MIERVVPEDSEENNIVLGMIISSEYIKSIQKIYKPEFFTQFYTRAVSKWCMEHFEKYGKAPLTDIKSIFETQKAKIQDPDKIETISIFLERINEKYIEENKKYNVEYNSDRAIEFFKDSSLLALEERIRGFRFKKDYAQAEALVSKYQRIEKNVHSGVDVFEDINSTINAINSRNEGDTLFYYPGELGRLLGPIRREDFFLWAGPGGRGKSYFLLETALIAVLNGLNASLFTFELPEKDYLIRLAQRLTGCLEPPENEYDKMSEEIEIPYFDFNYAKNNLIHHKKELKYRITSDEAARKLRAVKKIIKSKKLKIIYSPEKSKTISDINADLENLVHYENFIPDVILTDYADVIKPLYKDEKRHQIDEIYSWHRSIGQIYKAAVFTGSHTKAQTLGRDIKGGEDLSEDYRKYNHMTKGAALNQTDEEDEQGIIRINPLKNTRGKKKSIYEAVVLQCLDIGQVILDSRVVRKEGK
jgi:hypothetical protein